MNAKKTHFNRLLLKEKDYFSNIRLNLTTFVRCGNNKILEIGCGIGNTGRAIKDEGKAEEVVGIEIVPEVAKIAEDKLDKVICEDIETLELPYKEYFDYVIAGDVLEHLYDPWQVVKKIKNCLKGKGCIIASIPNIRNWRVLRDLIFKGNWGYAKAGLLDITHLRFFTKKSIVELFENNGFTKIEVTPVFKIEYRKTKRNLANILTFCLFEEFLTEQYIVKARKL